MLDLQPADKHLIFVPMNLEACQHTHNFTKKRDYELCFSKNPTTSLAAKYILLMTLSDVVFMGLMIGASVCTALLYRHHEGIFTPSEMPLDSPLSQKPFKLSYF